jgi:predicted aspartyl protease
VSTYAFSFHQQQPVVTLNLLTPDPLRANPPVRRVTLLVDTGFSDYLQIDWETFLTLDLQHHTIGTINSELADGSSVTDLVASVRVIIPECGVDRVLRCLSNPEYGEELLLVGGYFLKDRQAIIDYSAEQTTLSD